MSQTVSASPSLLNRKATPFVVLFVFAFAIYANTLFHDYALDDDIVIVKNEYTQQGLSGLGKIFSSDAFEAYFQGKKDLVAGGRYRPLSVATFAIENEFLGTNPQVSHFFNIIFFGLLGLILYELLTQLLPTGGKSLWWTTPAFLVTLIFLAHPIHTEVVANIKGRDEILTMLFALLALRLSLSWHDKGTVIPLILAQIVFFLALLAKESSLPFLAIVPMTLWFFRKTDWLRAVIVTGALILTFFGYLLLRYNMVGLSLGEPSDEILNNPFIGVGFMDRLATIFETFGIYLLKIIVPYPLTHDYYYNQVPVISWANWKAIVPAVIYLGGVVYALIGITRKSKVAYGLLFYFAALSIVSNIVFSIGTTMGERFVFIPSLGLILAGVLALDPWLRKQKPVKPVLYGLFAVVAIFSILTITRNYAWKDNFTLFTTDVLTSTNSAKARTSAGGALVEAADSMAIGPRRTQYYQTAAEHLEKAIEIYPQHSQAYLLLGNAYNGLDQYSRSLAAYESALALKPRFGDAYRNAAVVAARAKEYLRAAAYWRSYEELAPGQAVVWYSRGQNFMNARVGDSAVFAFKRNLELNPQNWEAMGNIALVYGRDLGRFDLAIEYGEKAISMQPRAEWLYENLGIAYAMGGRLTESLQTFQNGLTQFPQSAKLYYNAGLTYQNLGDQENANLMFQKVREINPSMLPTGTP